MPVKHRTFSNDLKAKDLCYSDDFFKLRSEKVIPSDSFTFDVYEAFKDVNDFKTNNFSNLFLIKKQRNSNWLLAKVKLRDKLNGLATTLSWYAYDVDFLDEQGSWLYFSKNYEMFDINVSSVLCVVTYGRPLKNYSNYIFHLEFLDDNTCRISHTFGDLTFYLCVLDDKSIHFSKNIDGEKEVFVYNIDDGHLRLFKKVNHKKYNVRDEIVGTYNRLYLLAIRRAEDMSATLILDLNVNDLSSDSLIYVNENSLMFDFYLDGSWVTYDMGNALASVDRVRSAFNLETQALLHHEYNKDLGINFIPLKNNFTYKGNSLSGNNTNLTDVYTPDVDYRTYTTINSGINQEKGNDNIILNFTFVDQEILVNLGLDLTFTIPEKSLESTNMLDPLWPYKYINLNDTKFIKNGSFGSNVPYFADKVKKLQTYKTEVRKEDGSAASPNNETYLCSWLYKPNHLSLAIWLDRYYYPDVISRSDALKANSIFEPSFENILDKNYIGNKDVLTDVKDFISKRTYFDKKSDLIIESGNTYRYLRISEDAIKEVVLKINNDSITNVRSKSGKDLPLEEYFQLNNLDYRIINYKDWGKTNAINFNADFYLRRDKRMGIQLFGSDYKHGFNIQNRKDLVPFHYYATDKVLYLLNNKMEIVHQFDLYSKYNDTILKVFLGDVFDDVIIMSGIWMYIFSYDLRLKSRIDMTATPDGHNGILELDTLVSAEYGDVSLINYPYNNYCTKDEYAFICEDYGLIDLTINLDLYTVEFEGKLIAQTGVLVSYNIVTLGYVLIPSNLCDIMCTLKPIIYKNNLYVPIKQNIIKIIMCPDSEKDYLKFNEENRLEYPAAARLLHSSEYSLNYTKTNNTGDSTEKLGLEQGFIEVENLIKHIYIDEDGNIYGLNFDEYAISPDGDTVYGLYASDKYIASGGWWWLFNQSLAKMKSVAETSKYALFASPNSIDRVKINSLGEMCLIRNFHNLLDNTNEDNYKRLEIYDKTKSKVYEYDLSAYELVLTLDTYTFIDEGNVLQTCFSALCKAMGYIYKVMYLSNTREMQVVQVQIDTQICPLFEETVNSNSILRYKDYNALYFNLNVPSSFTYDHLATIKWNLLDIQDGWYNINVMIDLDTAKFEVRINDKIYEIIDENTHWWFRPNESSNGTIFTSNYYIGILGKKYGSTLNKILKNSPYDPYACSNLIIDNMSIYKRRLDYYEYLAMRLRHSKVNKLILTLPCGTRNCMDEMVRFFKYNSSPAISNKVKINISGTGLETSGLFEMLKKEIMAVLENNKDCLVTVKDIEFIENE